MALRNMVLPINGGVVTPGSTASCGGQSGSYNYTVTFPSCTVKSIRYYLVGARYPYDGSWAYATGGLSILVGGATTTRYTASIPYPGLPYPDSFSSGDVTDTNGGAGWSAVTNIHAYGTCGGNQTGSGSSTCYTGYLEVWAPTAWTDDPLVAGTTKIRKVHIDEMRDAVGTEIIRRGGTAWTWTTDPTIVANYTKPRVGHITEIRSACEYCQSLISGMPSPSWTDTITANTTKIRSVHVTEIRTYINAMELK
jgi:hypothetical protein